MLRNGEKRLTDVHAFVGGPVDGKSSANRYGRSGALAGDRFAVKDVIDVRGHVTGCGNPKWAAQQLPAKCDAQVVRALRAAGAVFVGKTTTDEFAWSPSGRNPHFPIPVNANAPGRLTGGSSCGSAAAVAGGAAEIGLGTDTGGSVRIPGAFCGLYGIRPTHGAIPLDGVMELAPSLDTVGWLTRTAWELQNVGRLLLPASSAQPIKHIVWAEDAFSLCTVEVRQAISPLLDRFRQRYKGLSGVTLAPKGHDISESADALRALQAREALHSLSSRIERAGSVVGDELLDRLAFARSVTDRAYSEALQWRVSLCQHLDSITRSTAILLPTVDDVAPEVDATPAALAVRRLQLIKLNCTASLVGYPQVTIPVRQRDGLPIGLSVMGPQGSDLNILQMCAEMEPSPPR